MKTFSRFLILLFLAAILWNCGGPEESIPITSLEKSVMERENSFAWQIFPALNALKENENVLISPFSISTALSMCYNGARSKTRTAMAEVLHFSDLSAEDVNLAYKNLQDYLLGADKKVTLHIANSIWADKKFNVAPDFINVNRDYYDANTYTLDFSDPGSVNTINRWVSNNTNKKIESILDDIPREAVMYLINALYFKAAWTWEFHPDNTHDGDFTCHDGSIQTVNMMHLTADLDYYQNEKLQIVDLPYGKEKFSMTLILPSADKDINEFIAEITEQDWEDWVRALSSQNTELGLYLPRFQLDYTIMLKDALATLGMSPAFSFIADFTGINPSGGLYISDVLHKTYIEVNEEGTEAAAVTSIEFDVVSIPFHPQMVLNRPFLFIIRERESESIFFMGKILNIEQ